MKFLPLLSVSLALAILHADSATAATRGPTHSLPNPNPNNLSVPPVAFRTHSATTPVVPSSSSSSSSSSTSTTTTSTTTAAKTVVDKVAATKEGVFQKRPSVDAGLRYSSNDWVVNLLSTVNSYILRRIRPHLSFNIVVCLAVLYFYPKYPQMAIPMTGHSLLASSLGLLVSFRTNSAYARFWEARGHWTGTKSVCRNLAIMTKMHIEPHSPKAAQVLLQQLAAWPGTLMHLCLGGAAKLPDYAQAVVPPSADGYLAQPALPSMYLALAMQKTLHAASVESKSAKWHLIEAAHNNAACHMVEELLAKMSNCEKILRTPVPWTYSRHTSRFLSLWLGTLPLALVGDANMNPWLILAIVVAASYCLLGLEEIGHLIEQPFLGDPIDGKDRIWSALDESGEASALIKRGQVRTLFVGWFWWLCLCMCLFIL